MGWYSSMEALETMWCLEDKVLFVFFGEMRLFNSSWSILSISNIHGFNQVAGGYSGCEEACSLRLLKDFKPAHLSPEDSLDRELDIVLAPSISLGHDRLISWEQETWLLVAHSLGTHKEGNSCAIFPPASSWMHIVIDCEEKPSLQTPCFWFTLTTVALQFPCLCGFAFSVLWHFKPMADVKSELGFPELSTFDGRLVRSLKPQRRMGGEGVLWTARHCGERRWLFAVCHSESPLNPSQRWEITLLVKAPCSEWNTKKHLGLWILRLLWRKHCYLKWKIIKGKLKRIKESSGE